MGLMASEADRARNLALLDDFDGERDGSDVTAEDVVAALDRARQEQTRTLIMRIEGGV
ncbi:hypothetical protein [Ornithinimicrobium faecis]|uniref:hypothetical protein n=1 Tax=Ornithinimicrobium faecis TaxID=2934158 RepID=UPI00211903B5|nr:hypothetical protein [Ornithinimicrobium sp. HY1745]